MQHDLYDIKLKAYIEIGEIYFWTVTIHKWILLLTREEMKSDFYANIRLIGEDTNHK